jgi:hypothetical protein
VMTPGDSSNYPSEINALFTVAYYCIPFSQSCDENNFAEFSALALVYPSD